MFAFLKFIDKNDELISQLNVINFSSLEAVAVKEEYRGKGLGEF